MSIPDAWKRLRREVEEGKQSPELEQAQREAVADSLNRLGVPQGAPLSGDVAAKPRVIRKPGLTNPVDPVDP
jgi:hypothetical protein